MPTTMDAPDVAALPETLDALRQWQVEGTPVQLHPGDVGWFGRHGDDALAAGTRSWRRDGRVVAVGLLDEADLLRLGIAPQAQADEEVARRIAADVTAPERGVLPPGRVCLEAPTGALVHDLLGEVGWGLDEPWAILRHDLAGLDGGQRLRVEDVGTDQAWAWCDVHRAAFGMSQVSGEALLGRWRAMAAQEGFAHARCLLARDARGVAVASVIVWSAGPGRYGVLEPMGVHPGHRGRGYGVAITRIAARALRDLGSSSAIVATPAGNTGAVATYTAAGFERLPDRRDRCRPA